MQVPGDRQRPAVSVTVREDYAKTLILAHCQGLPLPNMSLSKLLSGLRRRTASADVDEYDERRVTLLFECRNCGTNVAAETERCPACDATDIATYAIDY